MKRTAQRHFLPFMLAVGLVSSAQVAWQAYGAVIWFARGSDPVILPGTVQMNISAWKLRDCRIVPGSELGFVKVAGSPWREAEFKFVDDLTPGSSKPVMWFQRQSFGLWQWTEAQSSERIEAVMTTVIHDCSGIPAPAQESPECLQLLSADIEPLELPTRCTELPDAPHRFEAMRTTQIGPLRL